MDNINTNINQIIFPKDMELRKIKKKKKKKGPSKKKIALDNLKQVLQSFDAVINEAKEKKISIPAELGQLPSNVNEVDSIKEIEELTADLSNRIIQIQALLEKGSSLTQSKNLFSFDLPQRAGIFPITPEPFLPPTMIPIPPQAPQRQPPVLPSPIEPPIIPSGVSPAMGGEDTEKDLERIRKEILDKLTPEQKAQAEADLEKEKAEAGAGTGGDKIPQPVSNDLNLETNTGVKYGNTTFNMTAPVGFYNLFRRYRQFIENLQFNTIKIKEGYFNIPENKYTGLDNQKNNILKAFNTFNSGLNANQVQYIDSNPTLSEIEKLLDNTLLEDLEDILKQELQKQKVNIIEISGGKNPSSLEAEEKANEEFEELLNSTKDKTTQLKAQIKESTDIDELQNIQQKLNNELKSNIEKEYNKLSGEEKTASLTPFNNLKATINDLVTKILQKVTEIESKQEPVEPEPVEPKPIEPVEPVEPVSPVNPIDDAGMKPGPILPQPRSRPRPRQPRPLSRDQKTLVEYVMNASKNYAGPQRDAIERLFSREKALNLREQVKDAKARKQRVKNLLLANGVDPTYFD
tara:strand:+ start:255 stop:1979 length:1725 start_codon:yes stop_codon:yes gene_type:complete